MDGDSTLTLRADGELRVVDDSAEQRLPTQAPLSYHQERLWFIDQFETGHVYPSQPVYHNIATVVCFDGCLDPTRLEQALNLVVARHRALRTNIVVRNDVPMQTIRQATECRLPPAERLDDGVESYRRWALAKATAPFRLDTDPLLRAAIAESPSHGTVLQLTLHHIVADSVSVRVIVEDLAGAYTMLCHEELRTQTQAGEAIEYAEYAEWQRGLTRDELEPLLFYWKWQLRPPLPVLHLPEARPRPAVHTYTAASHRCEIPERIAARIRDLVSARGGGISSALLAAFVALLHRYSNQEDIIVGVFAPGRKQPETERLVGPLANLLPIRAAVSGETSFVSLLSAVTSTCEAALDHQELPFEQLVIELDPEKDMSRTALFDVLFRFDEQTADALRFGRVTARLDDTNIGWGKYDFNLALRPQGSALSAILVYNADIYDAGLAEQMMRHYVRLLEAMVDAPADRIGDVMLLSPEEVAEQVVTFNATDAHYRAEATLDRLFEEQVHKTPDRVALVAGATRLTYAELDRRANRLAHYLQRRGAQPDSLVAVSIERSADLIIALLAVLKAGAAYLPIDPDHPRQRRQFIVDDAGVGLLITTSSLQQEQPLGASEVVLLDRDGDDIAACPSVAPAHSTSPTHLAYCIYTSGSTGRPKGALVEHRHVVRLVANDRLQFSFSETDVWTLFHSAAFDFSVWEMYGALLSGACLVVVPKTSTRDPALLVSLLIDERVTVLNQTPSAFASLSQALLQHAAPTLSLRYVIFGGESLHPGDLRRWRERYPAVRLINMYGITETTVHVTFKEITQPDIETNINNVGVPIPTTTVLVLDDRMRLQPRGVAGEIYVGGAGVCRGYLRRDDLTAARFVANPYRPGEVLYRSGDLGSLLPTGELVHLGRIDDQVQIRGFRVELGEVHRHLIEHPLVSQAEVVARTVQSHQPQLVAYVVAAADLGVTALRQHLARHLPDYMIPSAFVFLKTLPLTANGKVDRRALPEPEHTPSTSDAAYVGPRTSTEDVLRALWESTLGRAHVGVHDNFFELGGHSLLATQLFARIRDTFAVELPLRLLFENPTVAGLAEPLDAAVLGSRVAAAPPIERRPHTGPLPLSFAQQRLWLLHELDRSDSAYNVPVLFRLRGPLDVRALRQSIAGMLRRHESLRTAFRRENGNPVQVVCEDVADPLREIDLRGMSPTDAEARALEIAETEAWLPFDLSVPPLLRATLMALSDQDRLLLLTAHHIVSDEWSSEIFVRELTTLYAHYRDGAPITLPELPIQYADFALWQRDWLRGEVPGQLLGYWQTQLAGAPATIALPVDQPPAVRQRARAGTQTFTVDELTTSRLRAVGRDAGATLFMTLFAAFATLLHRYSGQEDLAIGTPIANRRLTETESVIGFFVNTLILRTDFSGRPAFREVVQRVRQIALDAYAHQDLPFEQVVQALHPDRTPGRTPLVQVMFSLQTARPDQLDLLDVEATPVLLAPRSAKFDLTMLLADNRRSLTGALEYNADAFSPVVARRIVEHFQILLESVAANPWQSVSVLSLCSPDEFRTLVGDRAGGATEYPRNIAIPAAFEARVGETPAAAAVSFPDADWTYRELNERANQLAHFLQPIVARASDRYRLIGICLDQSAAQIVAMLAVLKIGYGYVPLDPDMPAERMAAILDDADVAALLTEEKQLDRLAVWSQGGMGRQSRLVCLDQERQAIAAGRVEDPDIDVSAADLAYVIYTSGSTGAPKGVAVDHRAILRLVRNTNYVQLVAADRMAQASNASFDAATFEIWGALLNGARLVGLDRQTILSPPQLAHTLRARGITVMFLTAALFNEIARQTPDAFQSLRYLLVGGEALTPKWVREVLRSGPPQHLLNGYGPTESTTFATWHPIEEVAEGAATIPIGTALSNTRTYVLDDRFQPVPPGIAGELFLAGDGLAHGYLGQPRLTAAAFLPNPWSDKPGDRLYRTGDIVRIRPDGAIEFIGRRDQQIKVRGYRIEPGEIEAALGAHPAVRAVTVVSHLQGDRNPLIAYVVPETAAATDRVSAVPESVGTSGPSPADGSDLGATLHAFLTHRLPAYMVPGAIVLLDELPLNANGKLDRRRLPEPGPGPHHAAQPVAARTPTEEILCGLWADLLGLSDVGVNDDFYDRGGHSLLATQLASRIRDSLGVDLPLVRLFDSPTPAALAPHVEAARQTGVEPEPPLVPRPRGVRGPASFAQERVWLLDQLVPGDPSYNVAVAIRLTGNLEPSALKRSLEAVVGRHDALRTTFPNIGGRPVPTVGDAVALDLPLQDLSSYTGEDQDRELQRVAADEARRPFALARGPMLRASLVLLGPDAHVLLLTMHHIVSDGWSMGVLLRELATVYSQITSAQPIRLPELQVQYEDFALWQRERLQGALFQTQLQYWKEQLRGAPQHLALPTDRPRPRAESFRGSSEQTTAGIEIARGLRALSRRSGTTLFMTLFTAFAALLQRYSGQDELVVGTPVANRTRREIEDLVGFFVNTLVLRYDGSGNPTFDQLLARVRAVALAAYDHQDLPFERLVTELRPERDLSRNPLFQVMFALQNAPMRLPDVPGLQLGSLSTKRVAAQFDLVLDVWETPAGLTMVWEYNSDLFDGSTIRRMASHFESILRAVAQPREWRVSELPLLSPAEERQLLALGRGPALPYPSEACIQQLFEQQVRIRPDSVAATHGTNSVTYAALNQVANRIAHWLLRRGVGSNQIVAVLDERGIDFLAAMLGTLKAGAAFLPIDPRYPSDRVRYMLSDSEVQTLITRTEFLELTSGESGQLKLSRILSLDDAPAPSGLDYADVTGRLQLQEEPDVDPSCAGSSIDLAYMLYTSGSTGLPKGALIRHNGAINHIFAQCQALDLDADLVFLQSAPSSSDISVWQFLAPVVIGGRTVIADFETVCNVASLLALVRAERVTLIELVPVVLQALLDHVSARTGADRSLPALRCAMVTGEVVQPSLVGQWFEHYPDTPLVNAYGPTEAADDICVAVLNRPLEPQQPVVPIGRPLANLQLFVLDRFMNLAVPGAQGEICVAGVGVGAGYWRREVQTRLSFVPNPFALDQSEPVIYRTGDLGRWGPGGLLELTGRMDDQVKIKGFRVEPGEIESALAEHREVHQAAIVVQRDGTGEKRLVAHVVPAPASQWRRTAREQADQLETWETLHDKDYGQAAESVDPTHHTIGWDSTYTGLPIPDQEMREYIDRTIERIVALEPRKVLEIGCGAGLLAFRLVQHCEEYWGTDISSVAVARLRKLRALMPGATAVKLLHRQATDFVGLPTDFDVVVINSVVQYFPSCEYLVRVLDQAVRSVRPGGAVFVGDVRDLRLLHAYHTSVQAYKAPAALPLGQLQRLVDRRIAQEQELFVDPHFFVAFQEQCARPLRLRVQPKRGRFSSELTRFRFDVRLQVEAASAADATEPLECWRDGMDLGDIQRRLAKAHDVPLGYRNLPNRRSQVDVYLSANLGNEQQFATAGDLRDAAMRRADTGIDPEEVLDLAAGLGYAVELGCSPGDASAFDVRFHPRGIAAAANDDTATTLVFTSHDLTLPVGTWAGLTNNPLQEKLSRAFSSELLGHLKTRLPQHMIPARIVVATSLPLTPAGKVDRLALPAVDLAPVSESGDAAPPRNEVERRIRGIWCSVLGVEQPGIHDNFFDLGGHSLKATQVVSRIAAQLDVDIPLREIFNRPTIAELAAEVESHTAVGYRPIERVPDADHYPVSDAQRRLWVLSQFEAASRAYNMPAALILDGPIDKEGFERAVAGIMRRHEALRTTFTVVAGEPRQRIADVGRSPLIYRDVSDDPSPEDRAREIARADAVSRFDLAAGPLIRIHLLRLGATRHVVLFNLHHIVADDRSMHLLVRDFVELYHTPEALSESERPPVRYRDYAVWQRNMLEGGSDAVRDRRYWLDKLAAPRAVLSLRTDFRRPVDKTYNGANVYWNVGPAVTADLTAFCRRHDTTLFGALLTIVKVLLFRYTGQTDIVVGSPVEGRTHRDLEDQVGFFVNMVALRDILDCSMSLVELLRRVRTTVTEALVHQNYPFDALVHELQSAPDVSRSPVFDVVVVLQNPETREFALPGVVTTPLDNGFEQSKFDLAFNFEPRPEGLTLVLVYNTDLFRHETIERMRGHLETLLVSGLTNPAIAIGRLDMLPAAERQQILRYSAVASGASGPPRTIVEQFAEQVRRAPDAVALTVGPRQITYRALDASANQCAHHLRACGVEPNMLVGICMDRSADMIVGLLAILKAGAAYVPIDLGYPKERLTFMLQDAGMRVVLTSGDRRDNFAGSEATVVCVDDDAAAIAAMSTEEPALPIAASDLAYVIYTSGSTGRPKGVLVTHANVTRLFSATQHWFGFDAADVWSVFHSYAFDFSVWEIWGALLHGGRLVIVPYWTSRSPDAFCELVEREGITVLSQTPLAFRHFADAERMLGSAGLGLRLVVLGGEALDPSRLKDWFDRHVDRPQVINMYGITETTVHVTYRPIEPGDTAQAASMVGSAIPDLSLYILDRYLEPVPFGVPGEIYVGGEGVALGYLNRPALTAERFVPDRFGIRAGARLYRSGDLGCYHPNGDVEYLGRADDQVKIRGFRIELGEIASVLGGHDAVRECAVIAHASAGEDKRLVAYVVPADAPTPDVADLRTYLQARLPDYMIPQRFIFLEGATGLPLTANGKLDWRAVPDPELGAVAGQVGDASPRTELERAIAQVWRDVLQVDAVGLHSNFFELGGDSIAIIRTRDQLRERLNIEVPLTTLFRFPTVSALADGLSRNQLGEPRITERAKERAEQQIASRARRQRRRIH